MPHDSDEDVSSPKRQTSRAAFQRGDRVAVQDLHDESIKSWAEVVRVHRSGEVTVQYEDTGKVEKRVASTRIHAESKDRELATDSSKFQVGDSVYYRQASKDEEDTDWKPGVIKLCRTSGKFDIIDSDTEKMVKRIASTDIKARKEADDNDIRPRKSKEDRKDSSSEEHKEDSDSGIRSRRKKKHKQTKSSGSESDRDSPKKRKPRPKIKVNIRVEFRDKRGEKHVGRVKKLRDDEDACDIEHESDTEVVSKRIPLDSVHPVSNLTRLWSNRTNGMTQPWARSTAQTFQPGSNVYYRTKNGEERRGVVMRVWDDGESSIPYYDIEDEEDGDLIKRMSGNKLRPIGWLSMPSMSQWSGFSLCPCTPALRPGTRVRFCHPDKKSGRQVWEDGVIVRVQSDRSCLVEYEHRSSGESRQTTVPNTDIQTRFMSPFSECCPTFELPTLAFPGNLLPVGSQVEVSHGAKTVLGSVTAIHPHNNTYTITFGDGQQEKNVAFDRVRMCLRKLRIGTEVEMVVEGPSKEVSMVDGEVAWVHRDEKVVVKSSSGKEIFAEVCSHALLVDGQPAFTAPLSGTFLELVGFYLNFGLEIAIFAYFLLGMLAELEQATRIYFGIEKDEMESADAMQALYSARKIDLSACAYAIEHNLHTSEGYLLLGEDVLGMTRMWFLVTILVKAFLLLASSALCGRVIMLKLVAIQDNFIDLREYQLDRWWHRWLGRFMGFTTLSSILTLPVLSSLMARLELFCLYDGESTVHFDEWALNSSNILAFHPQLNSIVDEIKWLIGQTTLHLFVVIALQFTLFAFPTSSILKRVFLAFPVSIGLTALVCAIGLASIHAFHFVVQSQVVDAEIFGLSKELDLSIVIIIVAMWIAGTIFRLSAATGRYIADRSEGVMKGREADVSKSILERAERGEFGLQAKREALVTRVETLQQELGMIRITLLRLQHHVWLHLLASILGIYASSTLYTDMAAGTGSDALKIIEVISSLWLVLTVLSVFYVKQLWMMQRENQQLAPYLLKL